MASRLTDELVRHVEQEIAAGNFRTLAFARFGISRYTWKDWVAIGNAVRKDPEQRTPPGVSPERAELCERLVEAIERAEGKVHGDFLNDLNTLHVTEDRDKIALLKLKFEFFKSRHGKLYSRNPNAIDDDVGQVVQVDAVAMFREMMGRLVDNRRAELEEEDAEG